MPTTYRKLFTEYTEEELLAMSREEACLALNDKQRKWCEVYVNSFNPKIAAKKAGYNSKIAHSLGWKLRQNPEVNLYLAWLKLKITYKVWIRPEDIIDQYARIAFADITDFVEVRNGKVTCVDSEMMDGQLVKSVKRGRDGIAIEMYDKFQALDKLERFFEEMPKDWRQKIEEKKLDLMQQKLKLEQQKAGLDEEDDGDDGFLDALKATAETVWDDQILV